MFDNGFKKWITNVLKSDDGFLKDTFPDENDYSKFLKEKWQEGFRIAELNKKLKDQYGLHFAAIHYKSINLSSINKHMVSELFGKEEIVKQISQELLGFERTILKHQEHSEHIAWKLIDKGDDKVLHFRIGPNNKTKLDDIIFFPEKILKFLISNFEICHIDKTLKNINMNKNYISNEVSSLLELITINNKIFDIRTRHEEFLKSIVLSFYAILTILKNEKYGKNIFKKKNSIVFNSHKFIDTLFLPICSSPFNIYGVFASLHHKCLTKNDCKEIKTIYSEYYNYFKDWENEIHRKAEESNFQYLPWLRRDPTYFREKLKFIIDEIRKALRITSEAPMREAINNHLKNLESTIQKYN